LSMSMSDYFYYGMQDIKNNRSRFEVEWKVDFNYPMKNISRKTILLITKPIKKNSIHRCLYKFTKEYLRNF